ncbi:MAG: hypothetical protein HN341_05100 [Verrucomicrobia bacterium]|jgi:hypothetical protein|nr:hypothetical protein [Verrucomicrobiota bacterium]
MRSRETIPSGSTAIVLASALMAWCAALAHAYPPGCSPFSADPPSQMPMQTCIQVLNPETAGGTSSRLTYRATATNSPMIIVDSRAQPDRLILSILDTDGRAILPPTPLADHNILPYVGIPYSGDLNADGKMDYFLAVSMGGCGSAALYDDTVIILSSESGYNVNILPTMGADPADLVDTDGDGMVEIVLTSSISIGEEFGAEERVWAFRILHLEPSR